MSGYIHQGKFDSVMTISSVTELVILQLQSGTNDINVDIQILVRIHIP